MRDREAATHDVKHPRLGHGRRTWLALGLAILLLVLVLLLWPLAIQTWADERGPCSLQGAPEGSAVQSQGWSWYSFSYSCIVEKPSGELQEIEVRWFT